MFKAVVVLTLFFIIYIHTIQTISVILWYRFWNKQLDIKYFQIIPNSGFQLVSNDLCLWLWVQCSYWSSSVAELLTCRYSLWKGRQAGHSRRSKYRDVCDVVRHFSSLCWNPANQTQKRRLVRPTQETLLIHKHIDPAEERLFQIKSREALPQSRLLLARFKGARARRAFPRPHSATPGSAPVCLQLCSYLII